MIKNITLLWTLLIFVAGTSLAQVSDGFDYAPGTNIAGNGAAGDGWADGWVASSDADSSRIAGGGVYNDSLLVRTANNRALIVSTTAANRYRRLFEAPLTADDGEFWFSAHLAIDGNPSGNVGTLSLVDTSMMTEERVIIGKRFGNRNVFATGAGSGGPANTGQFFTGNAARWLVGHMVYDAVTDRWQLDMWVDPNPASTPQEADAQITNKIYPVATINGVQIKSEGAPGINFSADDIYFGSEFSEVVPADLIGISPYPVGAIEKMDYPADEGLVDEDGGSGFDGAWTSLTGVDPIITADGIESTSIMRRTSGNKVEMSTSGRMVRSLEGDFGDIGRTFWVGWWFETDNASSNVSHLVLANENAFMATGPNGRLAQIGSGFNASNIGLVGGGTTDANSEDGHFVVLEIVTNGAPANDQIYVYIDPDPGTQPTRDMADAQGARNLTNWNAIGLLNDGDEGVTAKWDDIYVGRNYSDIVPDDLIDTNIPTTAFAFDQFNYDAGADLIGQGAVVNGWAGPWESVASTTNDGAIATGGVANDELLVRTSSNSFSSTSTGENNRYLRLFETPLTANENQEFWFSFQNAMSGDVGGNVGTLVFADTAQGDNYERIIIGKRFGNRNLFATGNGSGPTNSGEFYQSTSSRWVVGQMIASDTADTWILNLWVDPDPATEPQFDDADIADKIFPLATFNGVSIKTGGNAGLNHQVDDIFFGATFTDVVPGDLTPIEAAPMGAADPLNYAVGEGLDGQMGGTGWEGAWTLTADDDPAITDGGIVDLPLLKATSGTKATLSGNGKIYRKLEGAYGDNARSFWVGYWFDSANGGPNVTNLVLADSENFPAGGAGELLQVGRSFNGSNLRIIGQGQTNISASEGHFVVLELVTNGTSDADQVYMWVDPALDKTPGRDTALVVGTANLTNWDAIALKVAGDPGVVADWDDIYVGREYRDVVPGDLMDVQAPDQPVVAYEPFDYTNGEDLNTQDGGDGWIGSWTAEEGTINIAGGSIDSDRVDGVGNKAGVAQDGNPVTYTRPFFARFAEDNPEKTEVWMSFLMDVAENSIGNRGNVSIMDGDTEVLGVGATAGLGDFAVTSEGIAPVIGTNQSADGVNWIVIQMDLYGTDIADTARVWINPGADALPNPDNAVFTLTDLNINNGFDQIRIAASGAQDLDMFVDEIYTGFEFRDVSPKFGSDDPDLLAYEPFNYDAGQSLFGTGGINAFWDGVWVDAGAAGDVNELEITEGSTASSGFETVGNKAQFSYLEEATTIRADRELAFPMTSDGRTYWMTFFMNTTEGEALNNVSNVTLRNTAIGNANGQRLSVGRLYGEGTLGFVTPATSNNRRTEVVDEGLHWLVTRIATNADPAIPDTVHMWIDPPANVTPDTATALVNGISDFMKAGPIDIIRIRTEGAAGGEAPYITNFDELRIATTFASASSFATSVIAPEADDIFKLNAFPNPFSDELNIEFTAPRSGAISLELYDMQGRKVSTIFSGNLLAGEHQIQWQQRNLTNGFYYLRVINGSQSTTRKMILYK